MTRIYNVLLLCLTMAFFSCSEDSKEPEPIYDNSFILTFESDKTTIGHLNEKQEFTAKVYESLNENTISFSEFDKQLFLVSQNGPAYVAKLNLENLNSEMEITNSKVTSPSYLTMFSETEGLMISTGGRGRRRTYNLSYFDVTNGIGEKIDEISTKVLYAKSALLVDNKNVLIADDKELKILDIDNKSIKVQLTFEDAICGIFKDKDNIIWLVTEKRTGDAKIISLNTDYSIKETVTVNDPTLNLFKTSMFSMNKTSNHIYWSEVATGLVYRFNTETKTIEEFANPSTNNILLTSVIREHPITKQVYVLGFEDFFDTEKSVLIIYNQDKTVFKTIKNVGNSPIDIYFSNVKYE
ncbi:conserved exported protein of unknown function [Tenacibaculum soleae]